MTYDEPSREAAYAALYAATFDAILGYALRRVERPDDAADVVAETFLVAWRRFDDVPPGDEARLWLYGVARRTLANQRRGDQRRTALGQRLGERLGRELATHVPDHADAVAERATMSAALERLADRDREALELSVWEGLGSREIAQVLGLSDVAVRSRLSRARSRMRGLLGHTSGGGGHDLHEPTRTSAPKEGR